jgi:hypothetical protein
MKTIEKHLYYKPDLDAYVQQKLNDFDKHECIDAEHEGLRNKPTLLDVNTNSCYLEHHQKRQELIGYVAANLQPTILVSEVHEGEKIRDRKLHDFNNKLRVLQEKATRLEATGSTPPPYSDARLPLVWFAMCTPLLADGLINRPTFETYGYNFIESLCMAVFFAVALAVLAHSFNRIVGLGKTLWQRRAIAAGFLAILSCIFIYLASTRAKYLTEEANIGSTNATNHTFSTIPLALLSITLFIVALAVSHFFFPDASQRRAKREHDEVKRTRQKNADEKASIEAQIETIKSDQEELMQMNSSMYVYGSLLEERIASHAYSGFAKWKKVNMMHRPDHGRPLGYMNDQYPFAFHRNFKSFNL